ncbi:unnamed protein product [Paramecium octaurelia]|uniref:Uncharacterized protein n=1 Tax=Paramecium octaurelia TaxID=43137 RepID=A0A8S1W9X2_PAROT|nr:unnamed protein product [Paramecium octaurelia]
MENIVQSDIVLLRGADVQGIENFEIINQAGSIIKWDNQKDLYSVKIIQELEDNRNLNVIEYYIQISLQKLQHKQQIRFSYQIKCDMRPNQQTALSNLNSNTFLR